MWWNLVCLFAGFWGGVAFVIALGLYRVRRKQSPCNNPKGHQWGLWSAYGTSSIARECSDCGKREISL